MKTEAEEIAERIEREEIARSIAALSRTLVSLTSKLEKLERRFDEMDAKTEDLEDSLEDLDGGSGVSSIFEEGASDLDGARAPHAYQVITTPDGKVLCLLPKDPNGTYFPAAAGGKHLGASTGTTADTDAGPYPAGGPASGSDRPEWAHYGWYVVGTIDTESEEVNDKIVIATFVVPRDPAPGKIQPDTQVEGPKLAGIALYDADSWKGYAEQTWKEFDDQCSSLVRQVPIALIANGLVTQLTMMPYFYAPPKDKSCDGGSDSDSDGSDSDDDGCCPEYEIEKTSETSACTAEYKLKRTDCQGGVTYPGDTIEVPKPPTYHLSGSDASSGCATTISLSQIPCGGTAIPAGSVDIPKPKSYTISAGGSSGCVQQSYKLMETNCSGSSAVGASIDIPKPPEYTLAASGSCSKTVTLYKTPCGGSATSAGSFSFDVPPAISATSTGNSSGGALAGTVTVTPCGGTAIPINIYNGKNGDPGAPGCSPTISAAAVPSDHGAEAYTITPCSSGATPITVYHGKNGTDGEDGSDGCTFTPSVAADGTLSWANDCGRQNPASVNIKGPQGDPGCSPVISMSASVDGSTGTPGVVVTSGGTTCAPTFSFAFTGLKGEGANITGTFLTGLNKFEISSGYLVLEFSTITYPGGTTSTISEQIPVTAC